MRPTCVLASPPAAEHSGSDVLGRSVRVYAGDSGRMLCASVSCGALYPVRHGLAEIIACVSPPRQMGSPVSWPA